MSLRAWLPLLLLGSACHRELGPPGVDSLLGLRFPLTGSPALRLSVDGAVGGEAAEVSFDPSQAISFITSRCLPNPALSARVTVPDAFGPDETFPVTQVRGLQVGGTRFRGFEAAVAAGKHCVVVFGAPELEGLAIEVSPVTRTVHFRPSQGREQWSAEAAASGEDAQVLSLTKEPRFDWPLLPVRIRQGPSRVDATLLFSLREPKSRLFDESARAAGLRPGLELLDGLPLPDGLALPPELAQLRGFAYDSLELSPGFGLGVGSLELEPGTPPHAVEGVLGADVWSRFTLVYDVATAVVVLRRPRLLLSGSRAQCERGGSFSEEACFELRAQPGPGGVDFTATVWRPLPEGARLSLDLVGGSGSCRLGVTFAPGERGRSTQHHLPWKRLADSVPGCARAFEGVSAVKLGLFEEGALPECPGVCAYARDAATGRLSCECQPGVRTASGEAEQRLLELFKRALEQLRPPRELEPEDPP